MWRYGVIHVSSLQRLFILQKRAVRIVHNIGFREHTSALFFQSITLKFFDLLEFETIQIVYKPKDNLLPGNIQKMFSEREGDYDLRGNFNLKIHKVRTTLKSLCITICGVKLWNTLGMEIK